ncbi:hypothetical protein F5148DRAFT_1013746 [Russula earlei]|uniref:Uncharacterized protein n=1 Tax=Russula earlei TaxID=71964 RepID=A0ACC0UB59_9AGAM|nr:hypothetical protein F5148DRAFT_1013746 [Russula earlei]
MMIPNFSATLLFMILGVSAAPTPIPLRIWERDVWAPPITQPDSTTVWTIGTNVTATWDMSTRPADVTNPNGVLLLGHLEPDGQGGENLDVDHPLANGFLLDDGQVTFQVPNVQPNTNYIVALIGSSGNISPQFQITT